VPCSAQPNRSNIVHQSYVNRPGPSEYYSHFSGLFFAAALAFEAIQLLVLSQYTPVERSSRIIRLVYLIARFSYWTILAVSGLICAVAYGQTAKPDCASLQILIFLTSLVGVLCLVRNQRAGILEVSHGHSQDGDISRILSDNDGQDMVVGSSQMHDSSAKASQNSWWRRCCTITGKTLNRILMFCHFVISILFIVGAINLAKSYEFSNPYVQVFILSFLLSSSLEDILMGIQWHDSANHSAIRQSPLHQLPLHIRAIRQLKVPSDFLVRVLPGPRRS
jgi:hypothetical protein